MRYTQWEIVLACDAVLDEIRSLPADIQARYLRLTDMIEEHGPQALGMPHVKPLEKGLWELRLTGKDGIGRVLYIASTGKRVIVLHAFVKKTQKTPRKAIDTALRRLKEFV